MPKSKKKNIKVRDLKPRKDAKGGGRQIQGSAVSGSSMTGSSLSGQALNKQNFQGQGVN